MEYSSGMLLKDSRKALALFLCLLGAIVTGLPAKASGNADLAYFEQQIRAHPGKSGVYVLELGEEALMARAWLADNAQHSIEVQYFIWSSDNIGTLASEALLRAAERGVRVRVIVDDIMIDAPDKTLLALARYPNVEISIYNPTISTHVRSISIPRSAL